MGVSNSLRLFSGTITGKRIIRVDGKEVIRHDWLFRLVGSETFKIGRHTCTISIDPADGLGYEYSLEVDGKPLEKFVDNISRISRTWTTKLNGENCRIVLAKDTLDIWVNGQQAQTEEGFSDDGTETIFDIGGHRAVLKTTSSGDRRTGLNHLLYIDDQLVESSRN